VVEANVIDSGLNKTSYGAEGAEKTESVIGNISMGIDFARLVISDPRLELLSIDAIGILFLLHARTVASHQTPSKPSLAMRVLRVQSARALRLAISELLTANPPLIREADGCYHTEKLGQSSSRPQARATEVVSGTSFASDNLEQANIEEVLPGQMQLAEIGTTSAITQPTGLPRPELRQSRCPANELFEMFTRICTDLPQIQRVAGWHPQRLSRLEALWKKHPDLPFWESYFTKVQESDFLCGRAGTSWRADFDWILKVANFCKIIEGSYQNRGRPKNALFNAGAKSKPESYRPTEIDDGNEFAKMAAEYERSAEIR
jgi:hypothetical protein